MSAIVLLPIVVPAAAAAWPMLAAAATAAASSMGYAAAKQTEETSEATEVELAMENADAVAEDMVLGEELVFTKGELTVTVGRNAQGRMSIRVCGEGKTDEELQAIGQELAQGLCQQYAYHRLVSELKAREFNVVDEEVEEDGTVRMKVRVFQE